MPVLRKSLQFLVRVFNLVSLILCFSYFGTFLSTRSIYNYSFISTFFFNLTFSREKYIHLDSDLCFSCKQLLIPLHSSSSNTSTGSKICLGQLPVLILGTALSSQEISSSPRFLSYTLCPSEFWSFPFTILIIFPPPLYTHF